MKPLSAAAIVELVLLLIGMLLITIGIALYSRPAALIVAGVQLLIVAVWPSPKRSE